MVCARHSIYSPEKTGTLAVVNKTGAFFDSGFVLGDYMTLECCFKVHAGTSTTGLVLVGYYSGTGINDNKDYRLFLAGSSSSPGMYCDAGPTRFSKKYNGGWTVVKYPVSGQVVVDGEPYSPQSNGPYVVSGAFGSGGRTMGIFADTVNGSDQKAAIRYITVTRYGAREVLCDLWPDKRGGFYNKVTKNLILPTRGSVEIVDWRTI